MIEEWKDIKGYEGLYQVSNLGKVMSLERTTLMKDGRKRIEKEKILKPIKDRHGYYKVSLYNSYGKKQIKLHSLVMDAFVGKREKGMVINHIDEDKSNNAKSNLEYVTQKENINHGTGNERRRTSQPHAIKLKVTKNNIALEFNSITECATKLNLNIAHISSCLSGKRKTHGGWEFERI